MIVLEHHIGRDQTGYGIGRPIIHRIQPVPNLWGAKDPGRRTGIIQIVRNSTKLIVPFERQDIAIGIIGKVVQVVGIGLLVGSKTRTLPKICLGEAVSENLCAVYGIG
ncbi:MAG: hypothetical protein JNN12_09250 [Bacteroidetes Order II. Incertae sedis bacterium]|nr:hypothetical protein [Bacteroidetes Order II. bacterium]